MNIPDPCPAPILTAAGRYLFGERWQTALAEELGVTRFAVHAWRTGRNRMFGPPVKLLRSLVERKAKAELERARDLFGG